MHQVALLDDGEDGPGLEQITAGELIGQRAVCTELGELDGYRIELIERSDY